MEANSTILFTLAIPPATGGRGQHLESEEWESYQSEVCIAPFWWGEPALNARFLMQQKDSLFLTIGWLRIRLRVGFVLQIPHFHIQPTPHVHYSPRFTAVVSHLDPDPVSRLQRTLYESS